jgi:hypothetical protein
MTGVFMGNMLIIMMIGEINRKRKGEPISYFGPPSNGFWIFREYRRLYPNGKLNAYAKVAIGSAFIGMLVTAVCARIIG